MMLHETFKRAQEDAAEIITTAFSDWHTPVFFLQFSVGFEIDGLFDEPPQTLELSKLPLMPPFHTPDKHHPVLLYGTCRNLPILVALGHRHLFEGLGPLPCILPTALAQYLGVTKHVYIDPVLSLNPEIKVGTLALLTDFINGYGVSPLDGLMPLLDLPFTDMTHALSQHLNSELVNAFSQVGIDPRLCVYQSRPGAHFCTPAEAQAAQAAQADIIGHDMVQEIITAHAFQCEVAACALIAGMAPSNTVHQTLTRQMVLDVCALQSPTLLRGLQIAIDEIINNHHSKHTAVLPEASADEILFQDFKRPTGKVPVLKKFLKKNNDD